MKAIPVPWDPIALSIAPQGFHADFLRQAPAEREPFEIGRNDHLALVLVGDDLDRVPDTQPHCQQAHARPGAADDFPDDQRFPLPGGVQGHDTVPIPLAVDAEAVNFHLVLQHVKAEFVGNSLLQLFEMIVAELKDFHAPGADHVVVVLTEMAMLVTHLAVFKSIPAGKAVVGHQIEGVLDEIRLEIVSVLPQPHHQFLPGDVLFDLQKNLQNCEPILEAVDAFLFEEFLELRFFLFVNQLHDVDSIDGNVPGTNGATARRRGPSTVDGRRMRV
jgi:hypothetical protein